MKDILKGMNLAFGVVLGIVSAYGALTLIYSLMKFVKNLF